MDIKAGINTLGNAVKGDIEAIVNKARAAGLHDLADLAPSIIEAITPAISALIADAVVNALERKAKDLE